MKLEIRETPVVLRENAWRWQNQADAIISRLGPRPGRVLLGHGSAFHSSVFGAHLWGLVSGRQGLEFRPWLADQQVADATWNDVTALAFSMSGENTAIARSAQWLRERGAQTIAITNAQTSESLLSDTCDEVFVLGVGSEQAVPCTKAVSGAFVAAAALCGAHVARAALGAADLVETAWRSGATDAVVDFLQGARVVIWIAPGPTLAAAMEGALKLQEAARMPSMAYTAADFLHGPIASVGPEDRVVLLADSYEPDFLYDKIRGRLRAQQTPCRSVGSPDRNTAGQPPDVSIALPDEPWAGSLVFVPCLQQIACSLAEHQGFDPDSPPGLSKTILM